MMDDVQYRSQFPEVRSEQPDELMGNFARCRVVERFKKGRSQLLFLATFRPLFRLSSSEAHFEAIRVLDFRASEGILADHLVLIAAASGSATSTTNSLNRSSCRSITMVFSG
jgi:hypothetical protein